MMTGNLAAHCQKNAQCGLAGGTLPIKSDGNHDARGGKQILVNLSFEAVSYTHLTLPTKRIV